jgi:hypothetical protein
LTFFLTPFLALANEANGAASRRADGLPQRE